MEKAKKSPVQGLATVIGALLCLIFGLMLVCNITIIVKGTLYPDMPPSVLGVTPMAVLSGSMSGDHDGHIEAGDLIFIRKADPAALAVGDVIAFMEGKIVVTHRIIEVQSADDGSIQWLTKGDANNAADQKPVPEDKLVGIYAARIPRAGDVALFMQTPLGMALCVGVPLLGFIGYDIVRRQRSANRENARAAQLQAELERLRALAGEDELQ